MGSSRLVERATYSKEKSRVASAARRTSDAIPAAANAATSAFGAESSRRLRPRKAAYPPATAAYRISPRAATSAALPSSGTSVFLRLVLRRALRHERVLLRDEDAASELTPHVDVTADLEEVGHRARVDDRDGRRPVDVAQREAQAVAACVSVDRPHDAAGEAHVTRVVGELARAQRRRRAAREARVEQEDGEDRRDGERDDEARRAAPLGHAPSLPMDGRYSVADAVGRRSGMR